MLILLSVDRERGIKFGSGSNFGLAKTVMILIVDIQGKNF